MKKRYRRAEEAELQYPEVICMNLFVWRGRNKLEVNKNGANEILTELNAWNSGLQILALIKYPC